MLPTTYTEAIACGAKRYFTGLPCKFGHVAERITKIRICVECARAASAKSFLKRRNADPEYAAAHAQRAKDWKRENREKVNATAKLWRDANPEKWKALQKEWREKNPEKARECAVRNRTKNAEAQKAACRRWIAANPERMKENRQRWRAENLERARVLARKDQMNRKARKLANGGVITKHDIAQLFAQSNGKCLACKKPCDDLHVDHIIPLSKGGINGRPNLQLLCSPCNLSKGARNFEEWLQSKGYRS